MKEDFPLRIGRSLLALFAGFVLVLVLTLLTDTALRSAGVFPPLNQPMANRLLVIATIYRTVYGIAASYLTARLAPYAPMTHALVGGAIGFILSVAGAVVAVSHPEKFGAIWYPSALVVLALPTAWAGAKICTAQFGGSATA